MLKELKFEADWLAKDARKAAEKLNEWASAGISKVQGSADRKDSATVSDKSEGVPESR